MIEAQKPAQETQAEPSLTFVTFQAAASYKATLQQMALQDGASSISSVVRRLIRDEALRRGLPDPISQ